MPNTAYAQCANPPGTEGEVIMNSSFGVPAYCDGSDNWVAMSGGNRNVATDDSDIGPTNGLVGHWKMDQASGTNVPDSSGLGRDGTHTNATPAWNPSGGQINGALEFTPSTDTIDVGNWEVGGTGGITIAAWVYKRSDENQGRRIISKSDTGTTGDHAWALKFGSAASAHLEFRLTTVVGYRGEMSFDGSYPASYLNEWHHVAVTYDESDAGVEYYIDGVLIDTDTHNDGGLIDTTSGDPIGIGNQASTASGSAGAGRSMDGFLDDVRVYNRPLDAAEIAQLYGATVSKYTQIVPDGLVGHWRFDEGSGTTAFDSSGNGNDANLTPDYVWETDGVLGGNIDFEGAAGRAVVTQNPGINDLTQFTFTAWVKGVSGGGGRIAQKENDFYIFGSNTDDWLTFGSYWDGDQGQWRTDDNIISDDEWSHFAVSYDYGDINNVPVVYINGQSVSLSEVREPLGNAIASTGDLVIGNSSSFSNDWGNDIDDVRLYNRILTPDEIAEIVNAHDGIRYNATYRAPEYFDGNKWAATIPAWPEPYSGPSGTGYVPNAVLFGQTEDYLEASPGLANAKQFTLSAWIRKDVEPFSRILITDSVNFLIDSQSSENIRVAIDEESAGAALTMLAPAGTLTVGTWHHLLISADVTGADPANIHMYVDDVDVVDTIGTLVDANLDFSGNWWVGDPGLTNSWGGGMADLWFDTGTYIDFSVEANRRLFIDASGNPVNLGTDGSTPTGSAPDFFLSGATADWHENKNTTVGGFTEIGALSATAGPNTTSLGLVGHWKFDDESGDAIDSSGNGYDGTPSGNGSGPPIVYGVPAPIGTGVWLSGGSTETRFDMGSDSGTPLLDITGAISISGWVKLNQDFGAGYLVTKRGSDPNRGYRVNITGAGLVNFEISPDGTALESSGNSATSLVADRWYHIAAVFEPSTRIAVYIDGALEAENTTAISASIHDSSQNFQIGADNGNGELEGSLDDIRIYDRVLSDYEITQLYQMGTPAGSSTALPAGCPNIGDVCDDGTIYAGLSPDGSVEMYTTPADAGQMEWNDGNTDYTDTLSTNCTDGPPGSDSTCQSGEANTNTIVTVDSDSVTPNFQPHNAPSYCYNLVYGSADDWYLPALDELKVLYDNHVAIGGFDTSGSFPSGYYWTSSENGAVDHSQARAGDFSNGDLGGQIFKGQAASFRCARKGPAPRCANPYGVEGQMLYNTDEDVVQYCDGARWIAIGKRE